jgi:hypothetical protein
MVEGRINIYRKNGSLLGYFRDPKISLYGNDEYEVKGIFHDAEGSLVERLDFNPQSVPYWAEIKDIPGSKHNQLTNVYVQSGRQPMTISGLGS